ncbi:MAG: hypothetical protein K0S53_43 [Bacteroidetes bacterium]|jgi:hypothetical protein|nr:hypothetical protein [Bacteroidota bacterium]
MSNYIVTKKTTLAAVELSMCNDGIVRVMFRKNSEIIPTILQEMYDKLNEMTQGKKYPYIYYMEDSSVVFTNEGTKYSREHELDVPKTCNAAIVKSLAHRLLGNFYLKKNLQYPSKIFRTMEEAEKWCFQQLKAQV